MNRKAISLTGIFTGFFFLVGIVVLFYLNPQTYVELNNLSLAAYNISGMDARLWAASILYGITGIFNVIFCTIILRDLPIKSASLIGMLLLLVCGAIWLSFGLLTYNPTADISNHILLIRLIVLISSSFFGLLLVGFEYEIVAKDKFLKWYTLSCAGLILFLSLLSVFIYNDNTWIRTNTSVVIYFTWFTVFSVRIRFAAISGRKD
jgi:hypothetical protein